MAGPINNHGGLGVNGSKAGLLNSNAGKAKSDAMSGDGEAQSSKAVKDEVRLSDAGKQLNAQGVSGARTSGARLETPEQALAMAKQIASAMRDGGAQAFAAQGSGQVSGLKGLLMSA